MSDFPLIVGFQPLSDNNRNQVKTIKQGKGIYLYDASGKEYIEATSSFWVAALGFQNEELISSIEEQYRKLPFLVSGMHRTSDTSIALSEKLATISAINNPAILFAATGSEANDFLIKVMKYGAFDEGLSYENEIYFKKAKLPWGNSSVQKFNWRGIIQISGFLCLVFFMCPSLTFMEDGCLERLKKNFM